MRPAKILGAARGVIFEIRTVRLAALFLKSVQCGPRNLLSMLCWVRVRVRVWNMLDRNKRGGPEHAWKKFSCDPPSSLCAARGVLSICHCQHGLVHEHWLARR